MIAAAERSPEAILPTAVYTSAEAAVLLRVHRNTLRKLPIRRGRFGGHVTYLGEDLLAFLRGLPERGDS